jgi:hypothetical protein
VSLPCTHGTLCLWQQATPSTQGARRGFTVNPDAKAKGSKNKIDIILHKGGVPSNSKDAQAQISLLSGG